MTIKFLKHYLKILLELLAIIGFFVGVVTGLFYYPWIVGGLLFLLFVFLIAVFSDPDYKDKLKTIKECGLKNEDL